MAGLRVFFPDKYNHLLGQYGSHPGIEELLYIKFKGFLFHCFWRLYSLFIVKSPLNRHELYMSVIKRDDARRVKIQ
jgi:NADH dehydrogenase FAD-containing subunit